MKNTINVPAYINKTRVILCLEDGQKYLHQSGGKNEEGYSYTDEIWGREGESIFYESHLMAKDCDGPLRHDIELEWKESYGLNEHGYPLFQEISDLTDDVYARSMNY